MADAQDLKSWDLKKSCGFKSRHRHQLPNAAKRCLGATGKQPISRPDNGETSPRNSLELASNLPSLANYFPL